MGWDASATLTMGYQDSTPPEKVSISNDAVHGWYEWEDGNENMEDRAFLFVTLTPEGKIRVGGKGPVLGITTDETIPFQPETQKVVVRGHAMVKGPLPYSPFTTGVPDKNTGKLVKRRFQKKNSVIVIPHVEFLDTEWADSSNLDLNSESPDLNYEVIL